MRQGTLDLCFLTMFFFNEAKMISGVTKWQMETTNVQD